MNKITEEQEQDKKFMSEYSRDRILLKILPEHHYKFVHTVMRDVSQTMPDVFFNAMAGESQSGFLETIWEMTCELCEDRGKPYFSVADIRFNLLRLGGYPTVIFVMPLPLKWPDAYMAAAVLLVPEDTKMDGWVRESKVAYLTLERGIGPAGIELSYLCAWNGDTHVNLGIFDDPDSFKFCKAVEVLLSERLEELIGAKTARKWDRFRQNMLRSFVTGGAVGNA